MKKYKLIIFIVILLFICFVIINGFNNEHSVKYEINKYTVKESFIDKRYDFIIEKNKNKYSYSLYNLNIKDKRIIKEIKTYKKNKLVCILPIYKNNKITNELYCLSNNKQVSNYYLFNKNDSDYLSILNKVEKYNVFYDYYNSKKVSYKKIEVYQKNIIDKYYYIIWNYDGMYVLNNNKLDYKKVLDYDLYDNIMSIMTDKYFVLFENTSVNGIKNIYYYDVIKGKLNKFEIKDEKLIISKDSYINGVIGEDIYVTDRNKKEQYIVNVKSKTINKISDNNYIVYVDDEKKEYNKSDFFMKNMYFEKTSNYSYYLKDNIMYKKMSGGNEILLFELDDIKEWNILGNDILIVSDDTLYLYNDSNGLKKIAESNELKYNYKNICSLFK